MEYRIEHDSMGEVKVPADKYWAAQTQRSSQNFPMEAGSFCRGCGYCMPCPVGIEINSCARMSLMIRRAPQAAQLTDKAQAMMKNIEDCLHCGKCKAKCPYGLDTPRLLEENYQDYREILAGKMI